MRAAYLDDLRSKFLLENSVLKMEYAEVRVLHLGHKVGRAHAPSPPSPAGPPPSSSGPAVSISAPQASAKTLTVPRFAFLLTCSSGHFLSSFHASLPGADPNT